MFDNRALSFAVLFFPLTNAVEPGFFSWWRLAARFPDLAAEEETSERSASTAEASSSSHPRRENSREEEEEGMAEEQKPDAQLFQLLTNLLQEVESLTNQEEVELRSKIKALGLEVTKLPPKPSESLDELEIAKELDKLSAKLDDVDEMISSAMAANPEVQSLLSSTADVWMPIITASSEERRNFAGAIDAGSSKEKPEPSE
ncbi:hypothetical protein Taro_046793 [Colocasia esculenta]|uniref:Uncharacterized protein n=1 Tax=Colocasia esculenta TaxID=4460 RepID=A0A843X2Y5_COLES|nr:hypothetical protein [Colocasia esculenta]